MSVGLQQNTRESHSHSSECIQTFICRLVWQIKMHKLWMKVALRACQLIICYYSNARGQRSKYFAPRVTSTQTGETWPWTAPSASSHKPNKQQQKICQLPAATTIETTTTSAAAQRQSCLFIANIVHFLATKHIKTQSGKAKCEYYSESHNLSHISLEGGGGGRSAHFSNGLLNKFQLKF